MSDGTAVGPDAGAEHHPDATDPAAHAVEAGAAGVEPADAVEPAVTADRSWLVGVAVWLVGAAWFFRDPLFSGFDTITGDRGDARLTIFLHEHWWRVWRGEADWRSPPMFAPVEGALGFSDTFVLNQLAYAPLRLLGLDQFVSFQLTLIALTAAGFAAVFRLARFHLGLALAPACLLAAIAAFANNVFVDTGHPQIYAINVIAVVTLVMVSAWRRPSPRARALTAAVGGLLTGLLVWTNFYFGWFLVFFGGLVVVFAAALGTILAGIDRARELVTDRWPMFAAGAAGLAVGTIPVLATYLPVLDIAEDRSYAEVANISPRPFDLVNVGRDNVVWGDLLRRLTDDDARLEMLNRAVAPTPALLVLCAVATVALLRRTIRGASRASTRPPSATVVAGSALALTTWIAYVLPVQFGFGGLWAWTHRFVPGGSALRVYGRAEVVTSLLAVLTIASWLAVRREPVSGGPGADVTTDVASDAGRRRRSHLLGRSIVVALAFVAFEQLNTSDRFRQFDRSDELDALAGFDDVPPTCEAFYVTDAASTGEFDDPTLITAMLVAHRIDRPTINGYSGQTPPGWDLRPWNADYREQVDRWIAERLGDDRVCRLELTTGRWTPDGPTGSADQLDE